VITSLSDSSTIACSPCGAKAVDIEPARNQKYAYIAGYTEAGLPFGITWEETAGLDDDDVCSRETTSRKAILRCRGESVAIEMGERSRALQYSTGGHSWVKRSQSYKGSTSYSSRCTRSCIDGHRRKRTFKRTFR